MLEDSSYTWIAVKTPHFRLYYEADTYAARHLAELRRGAEEARLHALKLLGEKNYAPVIDLFYLDSREKMNPALGTQPAGWSEHQSNTVLLAIKSLRPLRRRELWRVAILVAGWKMSHCEAFLAEAMWLISIRSLR